MTPHQRFIAEQTQMIMDLVEMKLTVSRWQDMARLDYWGKQDLRELGKKMVEMGERFIAEAERQEAEHELEKVA